MADPWIVDAGGGGGQLLRTALCLAALQGRACRIHGIRAQRSRPGLARQHLAAVRAVAQAVGGSLTGAQLGSLAVEFWPGNLTGPLDLTVNIETAGSTMLVLQTLLPLLVRRGGTVRARGGTDNPLAPPVDFYRAALLPALRELGVAVEMTLTRRGYYPRGGGEVVATAPGQDAWAAVDRVAWSGPVRLGGVAWSSHLPQHVTERLRDAAVRCWKQGDGVPSALRPTLRRCEVTIAERPDEPADSPGAGLVLWAEDAAGRRLAASALGEKGKPAERVAAEAAGQLLEDVAAAAPCDRHLGDQLALWAALSGQPSTWRVAQVTDHLTSSLDLLAAGLPVRWQLIGDTVHLEPIP